MGLGPALDEEMKFDDRRITNASFRQYRVPHFSELPKIETVLVDRPDLTSVGAGETPIIVVAPAIANAVFAARANEFGKCRFAWIERLAVDSNSTSKRIANCSPKGALEAMKKSATDCRIVACDIDPADPIAPGEDGAGGVEGRYQLSS